MLSSSFSALRALLLAASLAPSVLSLPAAHPVPHRASHPLSRAALAARDASDYLDSILFINSNETSLFLAIEVGQQTFAAYVDSTWGGLVLDDGNYAKGNGSARTITIDESISIQVKDGREMVSIFEEEVDVEFFTASSWPSSLPSVNYDDIKWGYIGINMNEPMNPIYSYFDAKWPNDYSKWYIDTLLFYDWSTAYNGTAPIDFAGLMIPGQMVSWEDLGMTSDYVEEYGLPDLTQVANQPYVYTRSDGTISIDSTFWISGQQVSANSTVPKEDENKLVVQIEVQERFSMFPDNIVDALYKGVSGSKYVKESTFGYYTLPCDTEISLSIVIDGTKYAVFTEALVAKNPWGDQCIGSVFTKGEAVSAVPQFDIILGFQFLSAFYYRSGLAQSSNSPYFKFLPLQPSNDNWKTMSTGFYSTGTHAATAAAAVSTTWSTTSTSWSSSSTSWSSSSSWSSSMSTWTTTSTSPTSTSMASTSSSSSDASASGDASRIAGNLAAEDSTDSDSDSNSKSWEDKANLYKIIIIVLASVLGVFVIGSIAACVMGRRKKNQARPSAYRSLHEAESHEPKAPLYGAEGGSSRYADPYRDQ